jgi:putative transposase
MQVAPELLDQMLEGVKTQEDFFGPQGLLKQLSKQLLERLLQAQLTTHLGYEKHAPAGRGSGNSRNGSSPKTIHTEQGALELEIPRDRAGDERAADCAQRGKALEWT